MTIQVTGKNIEAGDAFKTYITDKISTVLEKYIGPEISGHIRLEKERGRFRTDCSIRLRTGLMVEAHGEAPDAYLSADAAIERLEKRVRRYKRRLKSHHNSRDEQAPVVETSAADYVLQPYVEQDEEGHDDQPIIVAETQRPIRELTVSEAAMRLDLTDLDFLVFHNAAHGELNVVYRRADGNIGWIDAKPAGAATNGRDAPPKRKSR